MVGQNDRRRAGFHCRACIFSGKNPFHRDRTSPELCDPFQIRPAQLRLELAVDEVQQRGAGLRTLASEICQLYRTTDEDIPAPKRMERKGEQAPQAETRRASHYGAPAAFAMSRDRPVERTEPPEKYGSTPA